MAVKWSLWQSSLCLVVLLPYPMFNNTINQGTKLRRPLCIQISVIIKDKSRHSISEWNMQEAKWRWSCEASRSRNIGSLTSLLCILKKLPECLDFHWGFTKQAYWLDHWVSGDCFQISAPLSPEGGKSSDLCHTADDMEITSIIGTSGPLLACLQTYENSRFQELQEAGLMHQDKGSNMPQHQPVNTGQEDNNQQIVVQNRTRRAWRLYLGPREQTTLGSRVFLVFFLQWVFSLIPVFWLY